MALQMLDVLPPDTLDVMSCFLTGWDLFQLSHINAQCWRHFAHSTHWDRRLKPGQHKRNTQSPRSLKRAYAKTRSFAFEGLRLDERLSHCGGTDGSGGVIVQDPSTRESFTDVFTGGSAFAVDTWFSLLDGDCDGILTGGVLFGGQSPLMRTCMWTNHHVAFVGVDGDRNLFCSMLDGPANCVATGVDFGRWYHLVLSYDGGVQKIYLDGELVSQMEGRLHHSWHELSQIQVGTGFVSSFWRQKSSFQLDTRPRGVRTFCGWHGFHGVVDEFRVWRQPLCEREVQALAKCQEDLILLVDPWFSLRRAGSVFCVRRIPCTRPSERIAELHKSSRAEWTFEKAVLECWQSLHNYLMKLPSAVATK